MRRVLIYDWQSQCQRDIWESMQKQQDVYAEIFRHPLKNYTEDEEFQEALSRHIREKKIEYVFSFNFFPVISRTCHRENVLYLSWVYDCPHTPLYSKTMFYDSNRVFTFDRAQMEDLRERGNPYIYHLPLAVNSDRLNKLMKNRGRDNYPYKNHITFVGSIYENNYFEQIAYLPPGLKGYLQGICEAQLRLYGVDLIEKMLNEKVMEQVEKYVTLALESEYEVFHRELFAEIFLKKYVSSLERKHILEALSEMFPTVLYSKSTWNCPGLERRGEVAYENQMPLVFAGSGLNLNLSIRSIRTGIPLRCMDIMGVGGALISNVQAELMENFKPEKEWISFSCTEELLEKTAFYLENQEERQKIALAGRKKVQAEFDYQVALQKIWNMV